MAKQTSSGWGVFGAIVIAAGIVAGFLTQSLYTAIAGVGVGLFFMLISSVIERLDDIIGLLRNLTGDRKKPTDSKNESTKE